MTTGEPILEFDIEMIKEAGYQTTTPIIVSNSDHYELTCVVKEGKINNKEELLVLNRKENV